MQTLRATLAGTKTSSPVRRMFSAVSGLASPDLGLGAAGFCHTAVTYAADPPAARTAAPRPHRRSIRKTSVRMLLLERSATGVWQVRRKSQGRGPANLPGPLDE